jgi:hypothetical protein
LIFSKLQGGYWPNVDLCAQKCANIIEAHKNGEDVTPYLANTINQGPLRRQASPVKKQKDVTPNKQKTLSPDAPTS